MARTFESFADLKTALIALGDEEMLTAVQLTPELAQDILNHDPVNRRLRPWKQAQFVREIEGRHWSFQKSTPLLFLAPVMRLADGQHRCRAVIEAKTAIVTSMGVILDTLGVDENEKRTLVDHLTIDYKLADAEVILAAGVTKALCHEPNAGNREWLTFFRENQSFILESVRKPMGWLDEQDSKIIRAIFRPQVLVQMRARAIRNHGEPAESVDQLLYDAINGGATAPEESPRRALARQLWDEMEKAHSAKRGPKQIEMLNWLRNALRFEREGIFGDITTARLPGGKSKRRKKPAARDMVAA